VRTYVSAVAGLDQVDFEELQPALIAPIEGLASIGIAVAVDFPGGVGDEALRILSGRLPVFVVTTEGHARNRVDLDILASGHYKNGSQHEKRRCAKTIGQTIRDGHTEPTGKNKSVESLGPSRIGTMTADSAPAYPGTRSGA
jgi:hypothetical protein